jgi:hypothetical protein
MDLDEPSEVYTLNDPYEAEIIRAALRGEGIACERDGERQAGLSDILTIGILVRSRDADHARRIIQQHETDHGKRRGVAELE